jgi:uncharacterized protein (UPF0333 family)
MIRKRGQAALEFLMTYGWAILAAIIVIGVLAYFGVFSPGKYAPKAFMVNAPFGPDEYAISSVGPTLVMRNGGGENLNISKVSLSNLPAGVTCTDNIIGYIVPDGTSVTVPVTCDGLASKDRFKADIVVTYKKVGGTLDQTSTGSITGTVA